MSFAWFQEIEIVRINEKKSDRENEKIEEELDGKEENVSIMVQSGKRSFSYRKNTRRLLRHSRSFL